MVVEAIESSASLRQFGLIVTPLQASRDASCDGGRVEQYAPRIALDVEPQSFQPLSDVFGEATAQQECPVGHLERSLQCAMGKFCAEFHGRLIVFFLSIVSLLSPFGEGIIILLSPFYLRLRNFFRLLLLFALNPC